MSNACSNFKNNIFILLYFRAFMLGSVFIWETCTRKRNYASVAFIPTKVYCQAKCKQYKGKNSSVYDLSVILQILCMIMKSQACVVSKFDGNYNHCNFSASWKTDNRTIQFIDIGLQKLLACSHWVRGKTEPTRSESRALRSTSEWLRSSGSTVLPLAYCKQAGGQAWNDHIRISSLAHRTLGKREAKKDIYIFTHLREASWPSHFCKMAGPSHFC